MNLALAPFRGRGGLFPVIPLFDFQEETSGSNHRILFDMYYVYILRSEKEPKRYYVGCTSNLRRRFTEHNRGDSLHTHRYRPWRLINYFAFLSRDKANAFEHYLKSGAGRRFQHRHFGE